MMKIFVTSDIHSEPSVMKKLRRFIDMSDFDMVIVAGDIGGKVFNAHTIAEFSETQYKDFLKFKEMFPEVLYILGNDDWFEAPEDDKHIIQSNIPNILGFEYVPFTPFSTNREVNENKIMYELNKLEIEKGKSIIVGHSPPYKCRDRIYNGDSVGSTSIRRFIEEKQPLMWICGHIHENYGVEKIGETYVFNASCMNENGTLKGWVIDTEIPEIHQNVIM